MWQIGKVVWVWCITITVSEVFYSANLRARAFNLPYFGSGPLPKISTSPIEQRALDIFIEDPLFAPTAQGLDVTIFIFHSAPYHNQADGSLSSLIRPERRNREHYVIPCRTESVNPLLITIDIHGKIGPIRLHALHDFSIFTGDCRGKHPLYEFRNLETRVSVFFSTVNHDHAEPLKIAHVHYHLTSRRGLVLTTLELYEMEGLFCCQWSGKVIQREVHSFDFSGILKVPVSPWRVVIKNYQVSISLNK